MGFEPPKAYMRYYPQGSEYCVLESCSLDFHRDGTSGSRPVQVSIDLSCVRLSSDEHGIVLYHSDIQLIATISKAIRKQE